MTSPDLMDIPDEWLEVYATVVSEDDDDDDSGDTFVRKIQAICRMHEIQRQTGEFLHGKIGDAESARAELRRRRGEPEPPKPMARSVVVAEIQKQMKVRLREARFWASFIPSTQVYGRLWYREEDVSAFFAKVGAEEE